MKINIVADSSINIFSLREKYEDINFTTVPFIVSVGSKDYVDDENINLDEMINDLSTSKEASRTSCPSTMAWYNEFKKEGDVIAITISSNLSGSYNSALSAKEMVLEEEPNKKIGIINSLAAGPSLEIILDMIHDLMKTGKDFEEIVKEVQENVLKAKIIFTLCSFDNLVKNGRMNKIVGFVAGKLHIWGIGIGSDEGTIKIKGVALGSKGVIKSVIEDIQNRCSKVSKIFIQHVKNLDLANKLKDKILEVLPNVKIFIDQCRGLCSYYAEKNGLIVSYI